MSYQVGNGDNSIVVGSEYAGKHWDQDNCARQVYLESHGKIRLVWNYQDMFCWWMGQGLCQLIIKALLPCITV